MSGELKRRYLLSPKEAVGRSLIHGIRDTSFMPPIKLWYLYSTHVVVLSRSVICIYAHLAGCVCGSGQRHAHSLTQVKRRDQRLVALQKAQKLVEDATTLKELEHKDALRGNRSCKC